MREADHAARADRCYKQLAMDAGRSPGQVSLRQPANQSPDFRLCDGSTSPSGPTLPAPVEPPAEAMPADDGIRLDDNQMAPPVPADPGEKEPCGGAEPNPAPPVPNRPARGWGRAVPGFSLCLPRPALAPGAWMAGGGEVTPARLADPKPFTRGGYLRKRSAGEHRRRQRPPASTRRTLSAFSPTYSPCPASALVRGQLRGDAGDALRPSRGHDKSGLLSLTCGTVGPGGSANRTVWTPKGNRISDLELSGGSDSWRVGRGGLAPKLSRRARATVHGRAWSWQR